MCLIMGCLFLVWHSKFRHSRTAYIIINILLVVASLLQCFFLGEATEDDPDLQGKISRSPIVAGIAYLLGFNLGLMYFYFRSSRNKSRIVTTRVLRYRILRVLIPIFGICIVVSAYFYFVYLD